MNNELTNIPSALSSIEAFANAIITIGEESPEKAYIIGNQVAKVAKNLQDQFKQGFQSYFDANKELPGGFECRVSGGRTTYDFSANAEWAELNAKKEALEETLKNSTNQSIKGNMVMDDKGNVIEPVPFKM